MATYNDKKEVVLLFNHDVGEAISVSAEANYDNDGCILARAAHHTKICTNTKNTNG